MRLLCGFAAALAGCTYITVEPGDSGPGDAATDTGVADTGQEASADAVADVADASVDVADNQIYCWHIVQNTSTWPNGPYTSQAPIPCGPDAGGQDWGAGQLNQSPSFKCWQLKCPDDDTVNWGTLSCTWGGYGSVCCPALHDGGCR